MSTDEQKNTPTPPAATPPKTGSFAKGVLAGALCVGVVGYVAKSEDRYPLRVEYELAKTCADGSGFRMSKAQYLIQQEQCLCSLEASMKDVRFEEFKKASNGFFSAFEKHKAICENKGRR